MMEEKIDRPAADELPLFCDAEDANAAVGSAPAVPAEMPVSAVAQTVPATPPAPVSADVTQEVPAPAPAEAVPEVPAAPPPVPEGMPVPPSSAPAKTAAAPARPPKTPPSPGTPRRSLVPAGVQPTPEFGKFLRQVREANGISLDELARQTRIKRSYLEAVEHESYSSLPAVVYALAYIKVLASYYGVDEEGVAILTSEVRKNLEYEAPDEAKSVVGYEPSDENRILLRRIVLIGSGGFLLLTMLITLAVLFFTVGRGTPSAGPAVAGGAHPGPDEDRLVELQPKPVLRSHVLPVP